MDTITRKAYTFPAVGEQATGGVIALQDLVNYAWQESAHCKNTDPDLFFPTGDKSDEAKEQIVAARAFCRQCDVRSECLQYAIDSNQEYGIWGGLTEDERRYMRRETLAVTS